MSWEQFWHGDPEIARFYREAHELKIRERNFELWLQGLYVYEAIGDMAPVLHAFSGKGVKPRPYSEEPHPITEKMVKERDEREKLSKAERVKSTVMTWLKGMQEKFSGKEGVNDGGEHD